MHQGTSLWIWAVHGFLWLCVAALVVAIGLALLLVAAFLLVAGVVAFLAWWGWLEVRDSTRSSASSGPLRSVVRPALRGW